MVRNRLLLVLAALPLLACPRVEPDAAAYQITERDQAVGGPAASATIGDFILENGQIRAGVLDAHCRPSTQGTGLTCFSPGPGVYGGSLADIDLRRDDAATSSGAGNDLFAELFDSVNMELMAAQEVAVLADGSDGGPAIVRAQGPAGQYITYIELIGDIMNLPRTWQITDYALRPGDRYVTMTTVAVFAEEDIEGNLVKPADPCGWSVGDPGLPCDGLLLPPVTGKLPLIQGLNDGATTIGDFWLAGGDLDIFVPTIGFDEEIKANDEFLAGRNSAVDPFEFPYIAATGNGTSYAMGTGGDLSAPMFTSSLTAVFGVSYAPELDKENDPIQPPVGSAFGYRRWLGVGQGDAGTAYDALLDAFADNGYAQTVGTLTGRVVEETTLEALSGVDVLVYRDTGAALDSDGLPPDTDIFTHYATDPGMDRVDDGSFGGRLPVGDYLLVAKERGRPATAPVSVTITEGATSEVGIVAPRLATVTIEVVDERGRLLPSKVSLRPADPETPRNRTDLGDPFFGGDFTEIVFLPYGEARIEVPAGRYDVFVTRGIEYSLWDSRVDADAPDGMVLAAGSGTELRVQLHREVDSSGFIGADLHVHAVASHDSGVSLEMRTVTMACEGVEFMASTDHDVIVDYRPVIDSMGLNPWLAATVGLETTTLELGHFLGFPLSIDYDKPPTGGAFDWTDMPPATMLRSMKELGAHAPEETITYIGHPRDGILGYFDQFGMNPFEDDNGKPKLEFSLLNIANPILEDGDLYFTLETEGIELLNGKRFDFIRTPTKAEMDCYAASVREEPLPEGCTEAPNAYDFVERTLEEQARLDDLTDSTFGFSTEVEGQVDDWFTLLNLGYRHTALGNSDTHGLTSTESGCPRNYVVSDVDDPELLDERAIAQAVKEHRVVATYGPLIRFSAEGPANGVGSDVSVTDGEAALQIHVQSPKWMRVDRVEVYENGRLIHVYDDEIMADQVVKLDTQLSVSPVDADGNPQDAWYVVMAMAEQDLAPLYTPVDIPPLELNDVVIGALSELELGSIGIGAAVGEAAPLPKTHPVYPYAITNPIWIDVDGDTDGDGVNFEALGTVPDWMRPAPE